MKAGTKVRILGVHRSIPTPCDDDDCRLNHYDGNSSVVPAGVRYHYEDGPREPGEYGTVGATFRDGTKKTTEPAAVYGAPDKMLVTTWRGKIMSVELEDLEVVSGDQASQ